MDDVATRLRGALEQETSESYQMGVEDGQRWAKRVAKPKQLQRLDVTSEQPETLLQLFRVAQGQREVDRYDLEMFEQDLLSLDDRTDDLAEDADYVQGVMVGALQIWEAVSDKL